MLLQIRDFMQRAHVVSTQQLTREFQLDLDALQPMLDIWVNKGMIKPSSDDKSGCQSACSRCKVNKLVYYQYVGSV